MTGSTTGRIIAFDIGDKWLGIARTDPLRIAISPLGARRCDSEQDMLSLMLRLAVDNSAGLLVIGLPKLMDGTLGLQAEKIISMANKLKSRTDIPVVFQDERFSTFEAKQLLKNKKSKPGSRDDDLAAAVILRDYLGSLSSGH